MALSAQQQQDYADFLRRFDADPSSISGEEAARRYHELIGLASPEDAAAAQNQVLAQLPAESRHSLAQQFQDAHNDPNNPFDGYTFDDDDQAAEPQSLGRMTLQAGQQDESTLGRIFNSPLGKMAMSAIVAYLARRILGGQQSDETGMEQQVGGGLDLGAILGALAQAQSGAQGGGQAGGGLDLGAILGALAQAQGGQAGQGGLDIGDLIGTLGGAQGGGQAPGHAAGAQGGGQPDLSVLLGGQGNTQGANSELGRILTSLGDTQPAKDEDEQEDKQS